jgi:predicted NBD/HSP70 family sugar kinase
MLDEYTLTTGKKISIAEFVQLFSEKDAIVSEIVLNNAKYLAYAAAVAANLFDPDAVVLGGDVLEFGDRHFEMFKKEFLSLSVASKMEQHPSVLRSVFGRSGVAVGGAQIILDSLVQ